MRLNILFLIALLSPFLNYCQTDIYALISESPEHTILTELLEISGIELLLKDDNYYSVLAPNDEAWNTSFNQSELDNLRINEEGVLEKLLKHHIIPDSVDNEFSRPYDYVPLYGNKLDFYVDAFSNVFVESGNNSSPPRGKRKLIKAKFVSWYQN